VSLFFALTYAVSWPLWMPLVIFRDHMPGTLGFVLTVLGSLVPSTAGILIVARLHGKRGVRTLLGRLLKGRVDLRWYLAVLLLPLLVPLGVGRCAWFEMNRRHKSKGVPMRRPTVEESAPARTDRPLRQMVVFLCITYALTLAIALALPHAGIAPLISIAVPVIAVALTVALVVARGQRRAVWAGVGFNPRRGRGLLIAVVGPVVIIAVSFGVAAAFG
jgi:hypothetical protein